MTSRLPQSHMLAALAEAEAAGARGEVPVGAVVVGADGIVLGWAGNRTRELADENAYQRHLSAHAVKPSAEEWRRFSEERLRAKYSRAKCC